MEIVPATQQDLAATRGNPPWQTDWESDYLASPGIDKFSMKLSNGELIAFGIKYSIDHGCRGDVIIPQQKKSATS